MKLDFNKELLEYRGKKIKFREVIDVKTIDIDMYEVRVYGFFKTKHESLARCSFVCIQLYNNRFMYIYDDKNKFNKILECIKEKKLECLDDINVFERSKLEEELWKRLFCITFYKYGINGKEYERSLYDNACNKNCKEKYGFWVSEYWKASGLYEQENVVKRPEDYFVYEKDVKEVYKWFKGVLPQNIEKTKEDYKEVEVKTQMEYVSSICGDDVNDKVGLLKKLEEKNGNVAANWSATIEDLKQCNVYLLALLGTSFYQNGYISSYIELVEYGVDYCKKRYDKIQESNKEELVSKINIELEKTYGSIEEQKKSLRLSIDQLNMDELEELYKIYDNKEKKVLYQTQYLGGSSLLKEEKIKAYTDVFRLGKILISDKLNQKNRNKADLRYIAPELIEEAMLYYYETDNIEEAKRVRSEEKYSQNKESGEVGEQKVDYTLKWLDKKYVQIEKRSKDRVGKDCILLLNKEFIEEKQEYDHIVVSEKGIFNIETKNYAGKIEIDSNGNWIRRREGQEEGVRNPLQQIRQHEKVLSSILPNEVNIISILCIANDKAIIQGTENCPIPVIKYDLLVEYIEGYQGTALLSEAQQKECTERIYRYML